MKNKVESRFLPWWLWVIVAIEIVVPTFFGIATIFNPSIWGAETFDVIGQLYVTRNFTMVLGVIIAVLIRNRAVLFVTIGIRYITDVVDIASSFIRGVEAEALPGLLIFTVLLIIVPIAGLRWLFQHLDSGRSAQLAISS